MAAALVLFLTVAGMNRLAGVQILDLGALFAQLREAPGAHLWVFLMLFSTAVPTVAHLCLALLGAQALVPPPLRRWTVRLIETAPKDPFAAMFAPAVTGLVMALPFACLGVLSWGLLHWGKGAVEGWAEAYGKVLLQIAYGIGAF